jgi:hypothetical protein
MDLAGGGTARRVGAALMAAVAVLAGAAGTAQAGTAALGADGASLTFVAERGELNAVNVRSSGGAIVLRDGGAPVTPGFGCAVGATGNEVRCPLPGGSPCAADCSATIDLGDADDSAVVENGIAATTTVYGGPGADRLEGRRAAVHLDGGEGADTLLGSDQDDVLVGGPGADLLQGRGGGQDLVRYDERPARVIVTLDGRANDGGPGERDDVEVEDVLGGRGDDTITGDDRANELAGGPGRDTIDGRGGDDAIDATPARVTAPAGGAGTTADPHDTVACGDGDDRVDADGGDAVRPDCEVTGVGRTGVRLPVIEVLTLRASVNGRVTFTLRWPGDAAEIDGVRLTGTMRLTAADGTPRTIGAPSFSLVRGGLARVTLQLNAASRRRLTQAPALGLFAVRSVRTQATAGGRVDPAALFVVSARVTIARPDGA